MTHKPAAVAVLPLFTTLFLTFIPGNAMAETLNGADTAWIMTSTALVLFMTIPGLSLFYAGLVRSKNVLGVLMQCFSITCLVSILWLICGYSIAFADGNALFGGFGKAMFNGIGEETLYGSIPESVFALFQMTFAIITPALIVGSFAERMKYSSVLLFTALWLLLVYAPITHWVWSDGGWLGAMGVMDFAGGLVVHLTAGTAALVAAIVMGKRKGFPKEPMPPHNMTMCITGAGMLWVGWFGFNGGSALASNGDAGMAMLVTHISAATGAFTWLCAEWIKFGKPSALGAATGMVAGLGTITPASGFIGPAGALVIGFAAGVICFNATMYLKRKLFIDDSLDVFPVHGVGGMLGTLLTAVFANTGIGLFSGQGYLSEKITSMSAQLWVQFIGVVAVLVFTVVVTWIILMIVKAVCGLRVDEEEEITGLDIIMHNERGYDL